MNLAPELLRVLSGAYPCPAFSGACTGMRWDPKAGHIPRGFLGATGPLEQVEVVLVFAEPGDPKPGDHETLGQSLDHAYQSFKFGNGVFHQKARLFLDLCWPGLSFDEQLKRVWMTESVLCSAARTTGPVPMEVERECADRYLRRQLGLFPGALVVALGGKARHRLARAGISGFLEAHAFGLPGCNQRGALPSWRLVADLLHGRLVVPCTQNSRPIVMTRPELAVSEKVVRSRFQMRSSDMPASYGGDALHGAKKPDGVNFLVGNLLEQGATMREVQERLLEAGKSEKAARMHLMFLHKNGIELFVNGKPYAKGQKISLNDFLSLKR